VRKNRWASTLLRERGLDAALVREELARSTPEPTTGPSTPGQQPDLTNILAQLRGLKGVTVVTNPTVGASRPEVAIYDGIGLLTDGEVVRDEQRPLPETPSTPAEEVALIRQRIQYIVKGMENAIANHEFVKARAYSDEERKERDNLRILGAQPSRARRRPAETFSVYRDSPQ